MNNEYNLNHPDIIEPPPAWFSGFQSTLSHQPPPVQTGVYGPGPFPLAESTDHVTTMPVLDNLSNMQLNDVSHTVPFISIPNMNPQPRGTKRKRKAAKLHDKLWEQHRPRITELYFVQDKTMKDVQSIMKNDYDFDATTAQYVRKIREWKIDKNTKLKQMKVVVRKRQFRKLIEPDKRPYRIIVRGNVVTDGTTVRWMKDKSHPEDELYLERPTIVTASSIVCQTISDRDPVPTSELPLGNIYGPLPASGFELSIQDTVKHTIFDDSCVTTDLSYRLESPTSSASADAPRPQTLNTLYSERDSAIFDGLEPDSLLPFDYHVMGQTTAATIQDDDDRRSQETSLCQSAQAEDDALDECGRSSLDAGQVPDPRFPVQAKVEPTGAVLRPSIADYANEAYGKENFATSIFRLTNSLWRAYSENDSADNIMLAASQCVQHEMMRLKNTPVDEFELLCIYYIIQIKMSESRRLQAGELLVSFIPKAKRILGEDSLIVLWACADLASIYQYWKVFSVAREMQLDILERSERVYGPASWTTLATIWSLSKTYRAQGSLRNAEKLNLRALSLSEDVLGEEHTTTLDIAYSLGKVYLQQGRLTEAERLLTRMKEGYEEKFGKDDIIVLSISRELGQLRETIERECHGTG